MSPPVSEIGLVASDEGTNGVAVVALALALVAVIALLAIFVRMTTNRRGALDRAAERLGRQPAWTRLGTDPRHVRRSQQFTAAAGIALLVAVLLLLGGLLMDELIGPR